MMYCVGVEVWSIFFTLVTFRMGGVIPVSAHCDDPGYPSHGGRRFVNGNSGFPVGTVLSFYCNGNYQLDGATKIECTIYNSWSGKVPKCHSQECPMPPPTFAHAVITSQPVYNTKGSSVQYACDRGYSDGDQDTRVVCDKDPISQGVKWTGNFTCKKKACGLPPYPTSGHVNYTLSVYGTIWLAIYYCDPGYVFRESNETAIALTCSEDSGEWPLFFRTCVNTCNSTEIQLEHGGLSYPEPKYYREGVEVSFHCKSLYRLEGSSKRRCLGSGQWDGSKTHCVLSKCGSPGITLRHGRVTATNGTGPSSFPFHTTVTFECNSGYRLIGSRFIQCLPDGNWSPIDEPTCQKSELTCWPPTKIQHGFYSPVQQKYLLNEQVNYRCKRGYLLWGPKKRRCTSQDDNHALWESVSYCSSGELCDKRRICSSGEFCDVESECLLPDQFEAKCEQNGKRLEFVGNEARCSADSDNTPTAKLVAVSSDSELDKMTIVVATAGSTLGALLILLTALVCFRRFHRRRRFRHSAFRSRRCSDDDRVAIIAAYAGDVHFILPSYDEAVSQVESQPPPPFETVVRDAQGRGNTTASDNSSNPSVDAGHNSVANAAVNGASVGSDPASNPREVGPRSADNQPINILRNPLSQCFDSPPNNPSGRLPSNSSEDDLTCSETRPLLVDR